MALNETTIRNTVLTVLAAQGTKFAPVGVSARHVHLSERDIEVLFGPGHTLTPIKDLVQPGQYAAKEQVTLVGPRGTIEKVRVLGPARGETQVEVSLTDATKLGVKNCPIRMSGKLSGTPGLKLVGPRGELTLNQGVIAAERHLHLSDPQAAAYGVKDGDSVSVRVHGPRPTTLEGVICRVGSAHELEMHIDTDEANACRVGNGELVEVVVPGDEGHHHHNEHKCSGNCKNGGTCSCGSHKHEDAPATGRPPLDLVTERDIEEAKRENRDEIFCTKKAIITPAAADRADELWVRITRV